MAKESIKEEASEGIKIISVVSFVIAGILFALSLFLVRFGEGIGNMSTTDKAVLAVLVQQGIPIPSTANLVFMGIVFLALSIFLYFLGRDLLNMKNWARIASGVIAVILLLLSIFSLINGVWSSILLIIITGLVSWYLLLNKKVTRQFN